MTERKQIEVSVGRLFEIHSGFVALKERKLPSLQVDLRVAAQGKPVFTAYDVAVKRRKQIIAEHEIPDSSADEEIKLKNKLTLRNKLDELEAEKILLPAPKKRLTQKDLPQSTKNNDSDANTRGLAGIMLALAPEYFDLPEEEGSTEDESE